MITKQQFIDSCLKEVRIYKHLYGKIVPGTMDFRPTEKQRTLKELLQFLMHAFAFEVKGIEVGTIGDFAAGAKEAALVSPELFLEKMDELGEVIKSTVEKLNDEQLNEEIDLFGHGMKQTRATWLLELILKNMVGYKMQLFLYIKQTGNDSIGTADVWRGQDTKQG